MKKRLLIFTATLGLLYITTTSYNDGVANHGLNRTGAAGSVAACDGSGCHASKSANTIASISIKDKATSAIVTTGKYVPNNTYVVSISGNNAASLPKFGFEIAATKADNTNAGTISATTANTAVRTVSGLHILDHTAPITAVTGGTYNVDFDWTAPASGSGTVTFYGMINAVNGNGDKSGDQPGAGVTATFTEGISTGINNVVANNGLKIYPNPCHNLLNIETDMLGKVFSANIYDLTGKQVLVSNNQNIIDVAALMQGVYFIRIDNGDYQQTIAFIKQ
jgi:hypothetical protein